MRILPLVPALRRPLAATALGLTLATSASAASLLIDSFDAPSSPTTSVLFAVGDRSFNDFTASVPGGVRGIYHHNYTNPLNSVAALSVGNGNLSVSTGVGARTEVLVSWGAFTRPIGDPGVGGPLLGLDVRPYDAFQLDFSGVSLASNINIVFYTSVPLDPANPLYYSTASVNAAPAVPGGAMQVVLPFTDNPTFNFGHVDGIVLVMDRANGATNLSWTLDSFSLVTAVPEPSPAALLVAGLGALLWLSRRRPA
ncbi:MAG: PEP-CTERM sorting domain-containing protein [Rubrivivax sp.]|jgi:hypothetical protein